MTHKKSFINGKLVKIIGSLLLVIFISGCSTMMTVNAVDHLGRPIEQARVVVDGEFIGETPNVKTRVSNVSWGEARMVVSADGYATRTMNAAKEIKIGPLVAAILLPISIYIPLIWVYGPKAQQFVVLEPEA